jgi:hypothetical protein
VNPLYENMSPALRESFLKWDAALAEWGRCRQRTGRIGKWAVRFTIAAGVFHLIACVASALAH